MSGAENRQKPYAWTSVLRLRFPSFMATMMCALLVGTGGMIVVALAEIGPSSFWHHLLNPHTDASAYDLLEATLAGGIAVVIALSFATLTTLGLEDRVSQERALDVRAALRDWRVFFPSTFLMFSVANLASSSWGFPRYAGAILVEVILGVGSFLAFARLNGDAVEARVRRRTPADASRE